MLQAWDQMSQKWMSSLNLNLKKEKQAWATHLKINLNSKIVKIYIILKAKKLKMLLSHFKETNYRLKFKSKPD